MKARVVPTRPRRDSDLAALAGIVMRLAEYLRVDAVAEENYAGANIVRKLADEAQTLISRLED